MVDETLWASESEEVKGVDKQPELPEDRQRQATPLSSASGEAAGQGIHGRQWEEKMGGDAAFER